MHKDDIYDISESKVSGRGSLGTVEIPIKQQQQQPKAHGPAVAESSPQRPPKAAGRIPTNYRVMSIIKGLNPKAVNIVVVIPDDNEQQHLNNRIKNAVEPALVHRLILPEQSGAQDHLAVREMFAHS